MIGTRASADRAQIRPMSPARRRPDAETTEVHPRGQIRRRRDASGRLVRLELLSASGKKKLITATFDWEEQTGERKANGANVHLGYFYYSGAVHVHTTWDDEQPAGTPLPFADWVKQVEDEFEGRARTGE
jgi:hypothetical protein